METVLYQNYFHADGIYYKPMKNIPMGSPLSGTVTELLPQYFEMTIKHPLETQNMYCKRYVDDILIICDKTKTVVNTRTHHLNSSIRS
jgi:hypothetical protein